jgi:uncharacterized protein (UPF0332 family)
MNADKIIILARKHVCGGSAAQESSARLCLSDAISLYDAAEYDAARSRALESLRYSVGIFHLDYQRAILAK